jgi:REP element-mobilizing transposase RayT
MTDLFRNKYRIQSNRLRGWDYAGNGHYYITIVTYGRELLFGDVKNKEMILNDLGQIVYDEFFKSFEIRKELFLGGFVLMPNHLHAIVILDKTDCEYSTDGLAETNGHNVETYGRYVETHGRASLQCGGQRGELPIPQLLRRPKSISSFVAGFKSSTIKRIDDLIDSGHMSMQKFNKNNPLWQANYYDHIIRNEVEYQNIANYIANNPAKWEEDVMNQNQWSDSNP